MGGLGYRGLDAWQRAIDLVEQVYKSTQSWPKDELYGLTSQTRRAAVSISANVAEGQGRIGDKEFLHHVSIAYGSLCELETHLIIARRLSYLDTASHDALIALSTEVARLLHGLMKHLQSKLATAQNGRSRDRSPNTNRARPTTNDQRPTTND